MGDVAVSSQTIGWTVAELIGIDAVCGITTTAIRADDVVIGRLPAGAL